MFSFKKIKTLALSASLLAIAFITVAYTPKMAYAMDTIECADGSIHQVAESDSTHPEALCGSVGIKPGATIQSSSSSSSSPDPRAPEFVKGDCQGDDIQAGIQDKNDPNHCGILDYLTLFIKVLSGLVGIVVVAMIIIGGIQYSASGGDPQATAAGKKRIINAIIALALYSFIFAFLQYLIPGGVL